MSESTKLPDKKTVEEEFKNKMNRLLEQAIKQVDDTKRELLESLRKDLENEKNRLLNIIEEGS